MTCCTLSRQHYALRVAILCFNSHDVVGDDVAVVGELFFADAANPVLGNDLPAEQLAHFAVGSAARGNRGDAPDHRYAGRPSDVDVFLSGLPPCHSNKESDGSDRADYDGVA